MAFTVNSTFSEIITDPSFAGFGKLIFPVHRDHLFGSTLGDLGMTFYTAEGTIVPEKNVEVVNWLKDSADAGNTIFYDIYTEEEKAGDPEKADTGLFFFRGEPGKPFAVTCAGGGFQFVGAIHSSFPLSVELTKKGYNVFAVIYRPDADKACEDLARAIAFIFDHADALQVDTQGYSLWGESAGARMVAFLGSYGTEGYGEKPLPRAAAVMMQYTGHQDFTPDDPPTYMNAGSRDLWHLDKAMEKRYEAMKAAGIPVELKIYEGLPHGYALGTGTVAEGWHEEAVAFWEKHRLWRGNTMKNQVIAASDRFWKAMEAADAEGMRAVAVPDCTFVHIGVTCQLEKEIEFYTKGLFQPTELVFHSKDARIYGDTAIVITDCDYGLLLGGKPTTHHFAVTEAYTRMDGEWKLVQFSFTALVYPSKK